MCNFIIIWTQINESWYLCEGEDVITYNIIVWYLNFKNHFTKFSLRIMFMYYYVTYLTRVLKHIFNILLLFWFEKNLLRNSIIWNFEHIYEYNSYSFGLSMNGIIVVSVTLIGIEQYKIHLITLLFDAQVGNIWLNLDCLFH